MISEAVILSGGRGTRLESISQGCPKALMKLSQSTTVLEHQLTNLVEAGVTSIKILTGYGHNKIKRFIDTLQTKRWFSKVKFSIISEKDPLGTGGALLHASEQLEEDFFLIFGDVVFNIDLVALANVHLSSWWAATAETNTSSHPNDSDRVVASPNGTVERLILKNTREHLAGNRCLAGIYAINKSALACDVFGREVVSLEEKILEPLVKNKRLGSWHSAEYMSDMGTPGRLERVRRQLSQNAPFLRSRKTGVGAVFVDRDLTLSTTPGDISMPGSIECAAEIMTPLKAMNERGVRIFMVTNQPAAAKGLCTIKQIIDIQNEFEEILGSEGVFLDDVEMCIHHPEKGFPGENVSLKFSCPCRKPRSRLVHRLALRHGVNLSRSVLLGDNWRDRELAKSCGMEFLLVDLEANIYSAKHALENAQNLIINWTLNEME